MWGDRRCKQLFNLWLHILMRITRQSWWSVFCECIVCQSKRHFSSESKATTLPDAVVTSSSWHSTQTNELSVPVSSICSSVLLNWYFLHSLDFCMRKSLQMRENIMTMVSMVFIRIAILCADTRSCWMWVFQSRRCYRSTRRRTTSSCARTESVVVPSNIVTYLYQSFICILELSKQILTFLLSYTCIYTCGWWACLVSCAHIRPIFVQSVLERVGRQCSYYM